MPESARQPVLHLIVSGAQPATDLEPFIKNCQEVGWDIHIIATPAAMKLIDKDALTQVTGNMVHEDEQPQPLHPLPPANALAVAPADFDTINKWAYGNNDNLALRILNEAIGLSLPIVVVPIPDPALARHPALVESLGRLRRWGVTVVFNSALYTPLTADPGEEPVDPFPWQAAEQVIAEWTRFARVPTPGAAAS
ncbi:MAG TPA: flavoprotein [Micromonospora sp.]|nr:flavoprotein [Micromonospora sp.]